MRIRTGFKDERTAIIGLFTSAFSESEGPEEGRAIGQLAETLLDRTPPQDILVLSAWRDGAITGCIMLTRLTFDGEPREVFLMAPVAVATVWQGQGIGQALISHGIDVLRGRGVDVAVTYGDPAYYARTGFQPVSQEVVPAPLPLSQPEGWQAQSLNDRGLEPMAGRATCVAAFDNRDYW
ncbi:MAG: GNAT family N-acetyltransferase [Pseudomonadota bacterium]|uniref:GNAT family N-acetyltransferase n=1 Tax=Roseovarius TaxID=74030 RepID=UPI0022A8847F|nr:N-acetyltransferase [Roseovarius sp. EGI FJ00037]MCZ0812850.1 N-acetyltransferase [Roseovarius sp. EGI FJ00037]